MEDARTANPHVVGREPLPHLCGAILFVAQNDGPDEVAGEHVDRVPPALGDYQFLGLAKHFSVTGLVSVH